MLKKFLFLAKVSGWGLALSWNHNINISRHRITSLGIFSRLRQKTKFDRTHAMRIVNTSETEWQTKKNLIDRSCVLTVGGWGEGETFRGELWSRHRRERLEGYTLNIIEVQTLGDRNRKSLRVEYVQPVNTHSVFGVFFKLNYARREILKIEHLRFQNTLLTL